MMVVGYVLPSTHGTAQLNLSGLYDLATGQKVANGRDYKWLDTATTAYHRTYLFYSTAGNTQRFWRPRLEMVDGTEPSIDELIATAKQSLNSVSPLDFASSIGLNGQFTKWLSSSPVPDGWNVWAGTSHVKETTITRTGPNALRFNVTSGEAGASFTWTPTQPPPVGSYLRVSLDMYIVQNTSGNKPGLLVRMFTNAGFTIYRDTILTPSSMATGFWQTVVKNAGVQLGEQIYRVIFYLMGSWNSMPPTGSWVGQVVFDSLLVDMMAPADSDQIVDNAATQILTDTASEVSITNTPGTGSPPPFGSGTTYHTITFTSPITGTALVSANGEATYDFTVTGDTEHVMRAALFLDGTIISDTDTKFLNERTNGVNVRVLKSFPVTLSQAIAVTRGTPYTVTARGYRGNSGATVTVNKSQMRVEIIKK